MKPGKEKAERLLYTILDMGGNAPYLRGDTRSRVLTRMGRGVRGCGMPCVCYYRQHYGGDGVSGQDTGQRYPPDIRRAEE